MTGKGKNEYAGDSESSITPPVTTEEQEHSKRTWDFCFLTQSKYILFKQ